MSLNTFPSFTFFPPFLALLTGLHDREQPGEAGFPSLFQPPASVGGMSTGEPLITQQQHTVTDFMTIV